MVLVRHEGKPTSGRYVYAGFESGGTRLTGVWYWQCDLCGEDGCDLCGEDECVAFGESNSMLGAFAQAFEHANFCLYCNNPVAV